MVSLRLTSVAAASLVAVTVVLSARGGTRAEPIAKVDIGGGGIVVAVRGPRLALGD